MILHKTRGERVERYGKSRGHYGEITMPWFWPMEARGESSPGKPSNWYDEASIAIPKAVTRVSGNENRPKHPVDDPSCLLQSLDRREKTPVKLSMYVRIFRSRSASVEVCIGERPSLNPGKV